MASLKLLANTLIRHLYASTKLRSPRILQVIAAKARRVTFPFFPSHLFVANLRVLTSRNVVALTLAAVLVLGAPFDALAQSKTRKKKKPAKPKSPPCLNCKPATSAPQFTAATPEDEAAQKELSELARGLHSAAPSAYEHLSAYAAKNTTNVWGARAALALGYEDYNKGRSAQALGWFIKAQNDTLLREYAVYWTAQSKRALKRSADAYTDLVAFQRDYPNTALREQFLDSFASAAVENGHTQEAIDALNAYAPTNSKPSLLLDRAHAYQAAHQLPKAAKDYQTLFYKFPLTDEGKSAGTSLPQVAKALGKEYAYPGVELQEQRSQAFYDAHKWREARAEFEKLLAMLRDPANPTRHRAQLRVAQARFQLKGPTSLLSSLNTSDPEVDAERLYALSQAYRSAKKETEMLTTVEAVAQKYPTSRWTEESLMATGNYYWVLLDRSKAGSYYQRVLENFPSGKNAYNSEWRVAWVAYLQRQPYADDKLTIFLRKYPVSANASDALYWLGRNSERSGNPAHARGFYTKVVDRFPQTYFARAATLRMNKLGPGDTDSIDFLAQIPPPPSLRPFDEPVAENVAERWARAQALRAIAFDASAELELKNAYFATSSPRFLLEAAQAAFDQGHYAAGMAYGRIIVPSFDSRKISDVPVSV